MFFPPKLSDEARQTKKKETQWVAAGDTLPFWVYTVLSVLLAAAGFSPMLGRGPDYLPLLLPISIAWTLCVYYACRSHGKRALWLLIGLPFAWSYLPFLLFILYLALFWKGPVF